MSDLINRESAIVRACAVIKDDGVAYDVLQELKAIPSAQSEKTQLSGESTTKDSTFDCISRQAAIDALGERPMVWVGGDYELGARNQYDADVLALETVPSAQPQRIKGRWVGTDYDGFADGNPVYYEWKCSACGCVVEDEEPTWNFCPSCGADMRGDEDE